jgi:hypothetical protein
VLLKLIVTQPHALLIHAANYRDLLIEDLQRTLISWRLVLLLYVLSGACLGLSAISVVTGVLLWGALPLLHARNAWVLVALPVLLFAVSLIFYAIAKHNKVTPFFQDVQEQIKLDVLAINGRDET